MFVLRKGEKKMRIRLTAALLAGIMLLANISALAAEDGGKIYLSETYNNYVTNAAPDSGEYSSEKAAVCEDGEKNKAMRLSSARREMTASFPVNCDAESLTVSFDIEFSEKSPDGKIIIKNGNTESEILTFDSRFGVKLCDGYNVGGVGKDKKTKFKIILEKQRMTLAIDGKTVAYKRYIPSGLPTAYGNLKFKFKPTDGESIVKLDNIYAYTGTIKDFPTASYNPETKEIEPDVPDEEKPVKVGNRVLLDKDFEDEVTQKTGFFLFSPKNNTMGFKTDKKTGNKYLEFTKSGTQDALFDFSFGTQHSDSRYFVMDFDMKITQNNPTISFNMYATSGQMTAIRIETNGEVTSNGEHVYRFKYNDAWVHFAICMDYVRKINTIYIDGQKIGEYEFDNLEADYCKSFRSYFYNNGRGGSADYDNIRFYEAKEPKENIYESETDENAGGGTMEAMPEQLNFVKRAEGALGDNAAISYYANTYYANGKKKKLENKCFVNSGGYLMLPVTELADALNYKADWNADLGRIIINDNVKWMNGDAAVTIGEKIVADKGIPEIKDGVIYFPARLLAEDVLNKTLTWDEKQFVIIGGVVSDECTTDNPGKFGEEVYKTTYWEIADMLNYDNPAVSEIKKAFSENSDNAHPRILVSGKDTERMRADYAANEMYKKYADEIIAQADKLVEDNQPTGDLWNAEGNYLATARQILDRVQKLGFAYFITNDSKYAEQAWAELYNVGKFETWDRSHWLDLAEFQAAYAIGYDWFFDYWTDERKEFIKNSTINKAFSVMVKTYEGDGAGAGELTSFNNRTLVFGAGTSMTAIAFFDDNPDYYADLLTRTMRNQEIVARMWYPDGAWPEGAAYWEYTMQYMIYYIASLDAAFGTDFRLSQTMAFNKAYNMLLVNNTSVGANNYSDVGDMSARASGMLSWLSRKFNDDFAMQFRVWAQRNGIQATVSMFDVLYGRFDLDFPEKLNAGNDGYIRDLELVTMRGDYAREATCVSMHGGHGERPHGHWDIGTYVVDMLGERFAYDYGAEDYGAGSEGTSMYRKRTEGHNCLVFDPDLSVGQTGTIYDFSPVTEFVSKPRGAYAILDMTQAYEKYTTSCRRGFMLANDRRSVIVRDEFKLKKKVPVYWFLQTKAAVELKDSKTAILTVNGKRVKLEMLSSSRDAKFVIGSPESLPTSPKTNSAQTVNRGYTKLMIQFEGDGDEYIEVRYIPLSDPAADSDMLDMQLSAWSIEDGEIEELPKLKSLYSGKEAVEKFSPDTKNYTVTVYDTDGKIPEITAEGEDGAEVSVKYAEDFSGVSEVKVSKGEYVYSTYQISYKILPTMPDLDKIEELKIVGVKASAEPQADNNRKCAIDRNLDTRWSAQDECWIEVELDKVYNLSRVGMITLEGSKRSMTFNIEVSEDGKTYKRVYSNMTSGMTDDQEYYNVSGARGKYVRINCFGTTVGNWNSIKEIYVYKDK